MIEHDVRPWGQYWVLDEGKTYKVKRIIVNPGHRLSLQFHKQRSEVWTVVEGIGKITIDDQVREYRAGEVAIIPLGSRHRIENNSTSPVILIEVQFGTYFGEDDIVRLDDDYSRN